jgi:hypothetical protein
VLYSERRAAQLRRAGGGNHQGNVLELHNFPKKALPP